MLSRNYRHLDRPEYSWKIARWTLNTNQSIKHLDVHKFTCTYHRALSLSGWMCYQCINVYKGGHLFCPRSLRVVFVFWIPSGMFGALFGSGPRTLFFSGSVVASPRLPLVRARRSFLSGVRRGGERHGPGVGVTAPPMGGMEVRNSRGFSFEVRKIPLRFKHH